MQIKLINLDRSPERLAEFTARNGHLSEVSRFRAVDGRTLDLEALKRLRMIEESILASYTWGAMGAAMSHLALWDQAVTQQQTLTVTEDDAIFNRHFAERAEALLKALPESWDFVLWGWNFNSIMAFDFLPGVSPCVSYFDQAAMRAGIAAFQSQSISPHLFRLQRAFGIVCYSISPKGAGVLRHHCLPLREMAVAFPGLPRAMMNNGIDIMMNDAYPRIEAYVSFPPLVITKNQYEQSTIQGDDLAGAAAIARRGIR
jgi:glycosyl transferase, family 25